MKRLNRVKNTSVCLILLTAAVFAAGCEGTPTYQDIVVGVMIRNANVQLTFNGQDGNPINVGSAVLHFKLNENFAETNGMTNQLGGSQDDFANGSNPFGITGGSLVTSLAASGSVLINPDTSQISFPRCTADITIGSGTAGADCTKTFNGVPGTGCKVASIDGHSMTITGSFQIPTTAPNSCNGNTGSTTTTSSGSSNTNDAGVAPTPGGDHVGFDLLKSRRYSPGKVYDRRGLPDKKAPSPKIDDLKPASAAPGAYT